jgi:hypothetical protein
MRRAGAFGLIIAAVLVAGGTVAAQQTPPPPFLVPAPAPQIQRPAAPDPAVEERRRRREQQQREQQPQREPQQRERQAREAPPDPPPTAPENMPFETWITPERPAAVLRALDRVTGRVRTIEAPVGEAITYQTLAILVRACRHHPPEDPPENAAFLEIRDRRRGEPRLVFTGWMFSSSPAIAALEHPVYDLWITECRSGARPRS